MTRSRFILDCVLSPQECEDLIFIHQSVAVNSYRHAVRSTTLRDIAVSNPAFLLPVLAARQKVWEAVEDGAGLEAELFPEFTGLMSWHPGSAIDWHYDSNREYLKQRYYSAVLYLNTAGQGFTGGTFLFQDHTSHIPQESSQQQQSHLPTGSTQGTGKVMSHSEPPTSQNHSSATRQPPWHSASKHTAPPLPLPPHAAEQYVVPQTGRLVAYGADRRNTHCVLPVTAGVRFTLSVWFTKDPRFQEDAALLRILPPFETEPAPVLPTSQLLYEHRLPLGSEHTLPLGMENQTDSAAAQQEAMSRHQRHGTGRSGGFVVGRGLPSTMYLGEDGVDVRLADLRAWGVQLVWPSQSGPLRQLPKTHDKAAGDGAASSGADGTASDPAVGKQGGLMEVGEHGRVLEVGGHGGVVEGCVGWRLSGVKRRWEGAEGEHGGEEETGASGLVGNVGEASISYGYREQEKAGGGEHAGGRGDDADEVHVTGYTGEELWGTDSEAEENMGTALHDSQGENVKDAERVLENIGANMKVPAGVLENKYLKEIPDADVRPGMAGAEENDVVGVWFADNELDIPAPGEATGERGNEPNEVAGSGEMISGSEGAAPVNGTGAKLQGACCKSGGWVQTGKQGGVLWCGSLSEVVLVVQSTLRHVCPHGSRWMWGGDAGTSRGQVVAVQAEGEGEGGGQHGAVEGEHTWTGVSGGLTGAMAGDAANGCGCCTRQSGAEKNFRDHCDDDLTAVDSADVCEDTRASPRNCTMPTLSGTSSHTGAGSATGRNGIGTGLQAGNTNAQMTAKQNATRSTDAAAMSELGGVCNCIRSKQMLQAGERCLIEHISRLGLRLRDMLPGWRAAGFADMSSQN